MDTLQLKIYGLAEDIIGGDCFLVDYLINGSSFLEMVREVELPYAIAEGYPGVSGSYIGLSPQEIFSSSSQLLNKWLSFNAKTAIFICSECGDGDCWGFLVNIRIDSDIVTWDGYENNHREWIYNAIPAFVFDKQQYMAALQPPADGVFICPECGFDIAYQTINVESFPVKNGSWSSVLYYRHCKRCGYPIPSHLGERLDGLSLQDARRDWVNLYRSAKSRPRKLPRPRPKAGEHWGMADLRLLRAKVEIRIKHG